MIFTKITFGNLHNAVGYLQEGKLNNSHNTTKLRKQINN